MGREACHAQFSRLGFKKRRFRGFFVSWNLLKFDGFVQLLEKVRVLGALKHLSAKLALQRGLSTAPCRNPRSLDGSALKEKLHGPYEEKKNPVVAFGVRENLFLGRNSE